MSTSILLAKLAAAGGHKAYLFYFPSILVLIFLRVLGKSAIYKKLYGSMQVNIDYTKSQLDWEPPFKVEDSLSSCWLVDTERELGLNE